MYQKLDNLEKRCEKLNELMSQPEVISNQEDFQRYAKEYADISKIAGKYGELKRVLGQIKDDQELLEEEESDIKELARAELEELEEKKSYLEDELKRLLTPKDTEDTKNALLEIRAGTGGEEASLFAADLFRMYSKYCEKQSWKTEVLSEHVRGAGGFKEIIVSIEGKNVFSKMKFESGTHRVQRIPTTEASGRIHTSAVTVAILPEAEEIDVEINENDLKIDVYRSSGPGGQSVNTTDSAVRITHVPTGIVVTCQDEKSQHKNKAKAMKILRARILDELKRNQQAERSEQRKVQVGTGDRSERIRTYNFPQGRMTDHRINLTLYKLEAVMEGELEEIIEKLTEVYESEKLKTAEDNDTKTFSSLLAPKK
jgi:peptide chain release factor 1